MLQNKIIVHTPPANHQLSVLLTKNGDSNEKSTTSGSSGTLVIEKGKLRIRSAVQNILFIQGEHVYSRIFFSNDQQILQRISLDQLLEKLPDEKFLRVHRSYIVNLDCVNHFNSSRIFIGERIIPIGRTWREGVLLQLQKHTTEL